MLPPLGRALAVATDPDLVDRIDRIRRYVRRCRRRELTVRWLRHPGHPWPARAVAGAGTAALVAGAYLSTGVRSLVVVGAALAAFGAYAAVHVPYFRLGLQAMRLPTNDALSSPVRTAEGTLCAIVTPIAICVDGRASETYAVASPFAPPSEVRALYAGIAAGFTRER